MAKMGRPKLDKIKDKVLSVRFEQERFEEIKQYAESHDKTMTQVAQEGIDLLMKQDEK